MPVKRRKSKHRAHVEPEAWYMLFDAGYDFLGDLDEISTDRATLRTVHAEEAWRIHGAGFLESAKSDVHFDPADCWALQEFGDPHAA